MIYIKKLKIHHLLWLALFLALTGSLKHLATIFASVDDDILMGWVQAVAVDAGLFSLAYSIRQRKADKRSVKPLWFGVVLFSGISIYGNLAYGLLATDGNLPLWIIASKPYILAGSLPVLVIFLSELLSDDRQFATSLAIKDAKKLANLSGNTMKDEQIDTINAQKKLTRTEKLTQLEIFLSQYPDATNTELAEMLQVSRGTVRNYKIELAGNGVVK